MFKVNLFHFVVSRTTLLSLFYLEKVRHIFVIISVSNLHMLEYRSKISKTAVIVYSVSKTVLQNYFVCKVLQL